MTLKVVAATFIAVGRLDQQITSVTNAAERASNVPETINYTHAWDHHHRYKGT